MLAKPCAVLLAVVYHSSFAATWGAAELAPLGPGNFSLDVDHRHNFCGLKRGDFKDKVLKDRDISVVVSAGINEFLLRFDSQGRVVGGLLVTIFAEVAKRGGFSWSLDVAPKETLKEFETVTERAEAFASRYDIYLHAMFITPFRKKTGLTFGFPLLDASPVLVAKTHQKPVSLAKHFLNTNFLKPFGWETWLFLLAVSTLTALAYLYIEWSSPQVNDHTRSLWTGFWFTLFLSFGVCTKGAAMAPTTHQGRTLVVAWSFITLLLASTYTANLASNLVSNQQMAASVASIADAVHQSLPICVQKGSAEDRVLHNLHPDAITRDPGSLHDVQDILGDKCFGVFMPQWTWSSATEGRSKYNPGCEFGVVGPPLMRIDASFASLSALGDLDGRCGHEAVYIINTILLEMYMEDWIQQTSQNEALQFSDQVCAASTRDQRKGSVGFQETGGIFTMYTCAVLMLLLWRIYSTGTHVAHEDVRGLELSDGDDSSDGAGSSK
mmetsp:Transcript_35004/g.88185  ORF Transcript_35004/g.88185 Transcript_35004/m.88185 type:complete len:495 (+) Transcript_35004:34-1518(+)